MKKTIDSVSVSFGFHHNIPYAAELAKKLDVPLSIFVGTLSDGATKYQKLFGLRSHDDPLKRVEISLQNIPAALIAYDGSSESLLGVLSPQTIFVSNSIEGFRARHTLVPLQGKSVFTKSKPAILIPLGCDPTSVYTYKVGLPFARRLLGAGGTIVLYHTTWRNSSMSSDVARDHMCEDARRIMDQAELAAKELGLLPIRVLEMAEDVVEGIIEASLRWDTDLIIMARDPSTRYGDYCERLLAQPTPVPVLVLEENAEREGSVK